MNHNRESLIKRLVDSKMASRSTNKALCAGPCGFCRVVIRSDPSDRRGAASKSK
jgi:hypothetical protein